MDFSGYDVIIAGCGLSGAVLAERLASLKNKKVLIMEKRDHIGGNCYDEVDPETGILVSKYGAHLFHTNKDDVWEYINTFGEWKRWEHKVVGLVDDQLVPIPVNITTVNMVCKENLQNEEEMNKWLNETQVKCEHITNGEEMAKSRVGEVLYKKIFKDYTYKQWAKYPEELKPEVLARIPIRNNFDDRYFSDKYQALPAKGYTEFFKGLLNHPNITVKTGIDFLEHQKEVPKDTIKIFTGPIDAYFNSDSEGKSLPKLEYRSINFEKKILKNTPYFQSNSVVNYPSTDEDFTRIIEYKHFLNQKSKDTVVVTEYTTNEGDPYYPVPTKKNQDLYQQYKELAEKESTEKNIHFIGRLANYKYFNMDDAIKNALDYYYINFN